VPKYQVRVTYTYPVEGINPKDALDTVPIVIKARFIGFHGEGLTEILDASTGEVVLTAELVTTKKK